MHRSTFLVFALFIVVHIGKTGFAADAPMIKDPKDALANIPRDVMQELRPGSAKIGDAVVKATTEVSKNAKGKNASFKVTVRRVDQFQRQDSPGVKSYRIVATTEQIRGSGTTLELYITGIVEPSEDLAAAKLKEGNKVTLTGTIYYAEIMDRNGAELHLYLDHAELN